MSLATVVGSASKKQNKALTRVCVEAEEEALGSEAAE